MYINTGPGPVESSLCWVYILAVVGYIQYVRYKSTYNCGMHTPSPDCVWVSLLLICVIAAVAATAFINGMTATQVKAAAGDDATFTCLARGFPETTITIQLSRVNASYTIVNQTLMTEATPTSSMEVTRTVTLHSVTVLDCGAVVTCEGSNMNSDGSTHTDQAAATLQVQGEIHECNVR